ncbi:hypothetical protein EBU71_15870 [bacterium]|nr:hypothetical protein [Candidatus Elulimicrobium humile]
MQINFNPQDRYLAQDIMVNSVGSENIHSREDKDRPIPVEPACKVQISKAALEWYKTNKG